LGATRWNGVLMAGTKGEAPNTGRPPQLASPLPLDFPSPFTVTLQALNGEELKASSDVGTWEEALAIMEKWFHTAPPASSVSILDGQGSLCYMALRGGAPFSQLAASL